MSKQPLISEKAHERQHTIRGMCKRKPVTATGYAEYLQDKNDRRMNTLIKIAPNFKKLMDSYIISRRVATHEYCIKHVIRPFVKETLCPDEVPENRKIITHHIGGLIEGLENADKKREEKIALSLESYLTRLVSTKYGTFTGGKRRRRSRKRKKRGGNITKEIYNLHELERDEEYLLIITVRGRNGGKDITSKKVLYKSTTNGRCNFLLVNSSSGRHIVLNEEDHERTNDIGGWIILKYGLSGGRKKSKKRRKRNLKKRTKRRRRSKRRRRR